MYYKGQVMRYIIQLVDHLVHKLHRNFTISFETYTQKKKVFK